MRIKTMFTSMPPPYKIDRGGESTAIVTFCEKAEQLDENKVSADVYMLTVPWTNDIAERVEHKYDSWLAHAKAVDFDIEAEKARARRDDLLRECDWTQVGDVPFTEENRQMWQDYREGLRDVPQQDGFPYDIVWPDVP